MSLLERHAASRAGAGAALVLAAAFALAPVASGAVDIPVYDDALLTGWQDWSWGTYDPAATSPVHGGTASVECCTQPWEGFYPRYVSAIDTAVYDSLDFWIHGGTGGGQTIQVVFQLSGTQVASADLTTFLPGGPVAGTWSKVSIDFAALTWSDTAFDGFFFWSSALSVQPAIYLDDIVVVAGGSPPVPVTISVDPMADRHPFSPMIFGVTFASDAGPSLPPYSVHRWGGNHTTRYNWQEDVSNLGSDWYFINSAYAVQPGGTTVERLVADAQSAGADTLITVPLIGWTPFDRVKRWGFSIVKYGPQMENECTSGFPGCEPDAGNGVDTDGIPISGNDPLDTSMAIDVDFVTDWMTDLAVQFGAPGAGGPRLFGLDNEPMLWDSVHRDVHPDPVDYAEIWQRTVDYGDAMKTHDPAVELLGPAVWGWCSYFYSASDGCSPGSDYAAHGGPFLEWYLSQVEAYRAANGVRLVDYLDIHYYPSAPGVTLSDDESPGTATLRLRSVKSLYDPGYVDESWISQPVQLIPRMKQIIATHAPGTRLAITEYNWGGDTGISSALAQVEVLGVFARESVDLASRWLAPDVGSRVEDAFELYLDYDAGGSAVEGESVRATSSDIDTVGSYAFVGTGGVLYLVLINKATSDTDVTVTVGGGLTGTAQRYGFDAANPLGALGSFSPDLGGFDLTLGARSATLVITQLDCALPARAAGLRLDKVAAAGTEIHLTWSNVSGVVDYVVLAEDDASGTFDSQVGTAADGTIGLILPFPIADTFYKVVGRNACGMGPVQ